MSNPEEQANQAAQEAAAVAQQTQQQQQTTATEPLNVQHQKHKWLRISKQPKR